MTLAAGLRLAKAVCNLPALLEYLGFNALALQPHFANSLGVMKFIFKLLGNDPRYERWRWQMFALTWLGYAGLYLTRKSFSIAKTGIGEGTEVGLLDSQMAWIDFGYLMAYAIGQFIWGITADRIGTRKVILSGMLVSILSGVAMGVSTLPLALAALPLLHSGPPHWPSSAPHA